MTHDVIKHLVEDYVTGELTEDARAPVAEHIAGCELCSAEVESIKDILARASALPKAIDPPADAWSNVRQAIERDAVVLRRAPSARIWWRPLTAAAAVLVVAAVSSSATYLYVTRDRGQAAASPNSTATRSTGETPASLAAFTVEENNYLRTASILQELLDSQQHQLAPETVAQLKASLRTIDEAILEARNALARDPANRVLIEMLSASYRQKVDLLRRSTEMTRGS